MGWGLNSRMFRIAASVKHLPKGATSNVFGSIARITKKSTNIVSKAAKTMGEKFSKLSPGVQNKLMYAGLGTTALVTAMLVTGKSASEVIEMAKEEVIDSASDVAGAAGEIAASGADGFFKGFFGENWTFFSENWKILGFIVGGLFALYILLSIYKTLIKSTNRTNRTNSTNSTNSTKQK